MPSADALINPPVSATSRPMESMQTFRLFLISLKSPWYVSVILGGMSPFEMRSTYSADTFKGLMTLSSVRLKPSMTFLKSP